MRSKPRAFWFHYNKPESAKQKKNVLTVHYKNQCLFVNNIDCQVPIKGRHRKSQPRFVMTGYGYVTLTQEDQGITAVITKEPMDQGNAST